MSWAETTVELIAAPEKGSIVSGPFGSNISARFFVDSGIPVIRGNNLTTGMKRFIDEDFVFVTEAKAQEFRNCEAQADDLVFTAAGTIGQVGIIPGNSNYPKYIISNKQLRLRIDKTKADPLFLYYWFSSPMMTQYIISRNSGSSVPLINLAILRRLPVAYPSLPVQRRIAGILSAYDDLIENNRRRIQLLEQAARLIYQEWFVRLRFPGHEHVRVVDGVPEGWERSQLCALCDEFRETVKGRQLDPASPYIGLEHMPRRSITLSDWGVASEVQSDKHVFHTGDILFGKIRPYFHKVGVCLTEGVASTDAIVIRPRTADYYGIVLMTVSSDLFVAHATQSSHGSKMPRANWKVLERFPVLVPPGSLLADFSGLIDPIVAQLRTLALTNRRLRQARDLLLPKLMSGEIEV